MGFRLFSVIFSQHPHTSGISFYWNDVSLSVEPYDSRDFRYYCGKTLQRPTQSRSIAYRLLVLDFSEACYGYIYTDGGVAILWEHNSLVPRKMMAGGQSQQRFQRARESAIRLWFKRINEFVDTIEGPVTLGVSDVYANALLECFTEVNRRKIINRAPIEYADRSGIFQFANKKRKEG